MYFTYTAFRLTKFKMHLYYVKSLDESMYLTHVEFLVPICITVATLVLLCILCLLYLNLVTKRYHTYEEPNP